jgi:Flp pilus assembly protein TadD
MRPIVMISLLLGGCSGLTHAVDAPSQPSMRVADAAMAAGAPEVALRVAELALAKQPHNVEALIARADALYAMGLRDAALATYQATSQIDPANVRGQVGVGRVIVRTDPHAAEAAFLAALATEPDNVQALNNLGVTRDMLGRNSEAQEAYLHALGLSPASIDVRINLATSLALSGHQADSLQVLHGVAANEEALRAWPRELARALTLAGDQPMAQQVLRGAAGAGQGPVEIASFADTPPPGAPRPARTPLRVADMDSARAVTAVRQRPIPVSEDMSAAVSTEPSAAVAVPAPRTVVVRRDLAPVASPVVSNVAERVVFAANSPAMPAVVQTDVATPAPVPVARLPALEQTVEGPATPSPRVVATAESRTPVAGPATPRKPVVSAQSPFVQLGSLVSEADAMTEWQRLKKRIAGMLEGREPSIESAVVRGRMYWRLRTFGFGSPSEASDMCSSLKSAGMRCMWGRG